jgi:negative regulator of flagellin synthesis FlgM
MDRIDMQGPNGISSRLKAKGPAPVAQAENVRPTGNGAAKSGDVVMATVVSAGSEAPVDQDRVAEIREAIEHGRYPVIPTKIADAMIAAGFLLRND